MKNLVATVALLQVTLAQASILCDHTVIPYFADIPADIIETIRTDYLIFYGHTSHGSQIVEGMNMVKNENVDGYDLPQFNEIWDDLGHVGDTSWASTTRTWLENNPQYNVVIWSWCGGCSDNTEQGISTYLATMTELEQEYPNVTFVYMTGHLDGTGPTGNLYRNNNQIRDYCAENNTVLFDFADIESYDPNGVYYPDETDACNWCTDWCATQTCPPTQTCAHSHCFNCYQKGKAFWWLMARVAGWDPAPNSATTWGSFKTLYR